MWHILVVFQRKAVGDPVADHKCWDRPESITAERPLTQVNTSCPGSDVAAETAAAMASASLVFKSDSTYSSNLLKHAKQLFTFADKHRGLYSENIPEVATYYNSTGYGDELLWAASWLYHATNDDSYLKYVTGQNGEDFANWGSPTWFSWDNKLAETQVLLSRLSFFKGKGISNSYGSGLQKYRKSAEAVMCGLLPDSPTATKSRTDGGLIWVSEWNALQHPVASAFLASLYSDYMLTSQTPNIKCDSDSFTPADIRDFARSQADYVLGKNPMKMSFLVGYGDKFPEFVHHRGASIPSDAITDCKEGFQYLDSSDPNPNVATGALVDTTNKRVYLAPFCNSNHWQLVILLPKGNTVVWMCSFCRQPKKAIKEMFVKAVKGDSTSATKWLYPIMPIQPNDYHCGYYVMKFMLTIVTAGIVDNWEKVFNSAMSYTDEEIKEIRQQWAEFFLKIRTEQKDTLFRA